MPLKQGGARPARLAAGFPRNRLLAALPAADFDDIQPFAELGPIERGATLQEFNQVPEHVFFIERGLASLQVQTDRDSPIEAGLVGRMGMVGAPVVLGTGHAPIRAMVEVSGEAIMLKARDLRTLMARSTRLQQLLLSYVQASAVQSSQLVLCNARHGADQRVARWLLLAADGLCSHDIPVTHEVLGGSLGLRRASVTEALLRLQAADAVIARRGHIALVSHRKIEEISCGCYRVISGEYSRLLARFGAGEKTWTSGGC